MTLKTSFFNKAIYKSTIKRFVWGSVLYFVILFIATGLSIFLNIDMNYEYYPEASESILLNNSYVLFPMLLAIIVPTVVAFMVFRFVHSKNQAIYTHSLPVSRKANFISQILGSFTLMYVPIILNTLILMLISICGYSDFFTVADCVKWAAINIYGIFLMFSCACVASFLTGNSYGMVGINILIHGFLVFAALTLGVMAEAFVLGYTSDNAIINTLSENNFAVVTFGMYSRYFRENLDTFRIALYAVCALLLYVISYFIYKKRRIENVGNVSGFNCLNYIFKYIVCFLASMFTFAVFCSYMYENPVVFTIIMITASVITYFAAEMILKKTLKVWYSRKGLAAYLISFGILVLVFSCTTFFGYETRIPDKNDIQEVMITNQMYKYIDTATSNEEIIDITLKYHKDITELASDYRPFKYDEGYTHIDIAYKLKNGKKLKRSYFLKDDMNREIMDKCYEVEEYKKMVEDVFVDDSRIASIYLSHNNTIELDKDEIMPLLREDTLNLSFSELYPKYRLYSDIERYYIDINYIRDDDPAMNGGKAYLYGAGVQVNTNYKKTYEYLIEKGYISK